MAHVARPLMLWPRWRHLINLYSYPPRAAATSPVFSLSTSLRGVHLRSRAVPLAQIASRSFANESDDDDGGNSSSDESSVRKSRNEKKRDAQRSVRWGMELAKFSPGQIKRIVRVADLEEDVFDAIMLVKGLGRDVREGKRRQFNYIGRLLREVNPELMDELIQATKEGDQSKFQVLSGKDDKEEEDEEVEEEEIEEEDEEEEDSIDIAMVTRWSDGLIIKDKSITNEIYSLQDVEFDRQELRRLVRKVHSTLEAESSLEDNEKQDTAAKDAIKSLNHFLRGLVKQLPAE